MSPVTAKTVLTAEDAGKITAGITIPAGTEIRLTPEQFVLRAIERLALPDKGKGIHTVYSGHNNGFRLYFAKEGLDPVIVVNELAKEGKIAIRGVKGGVMMYKPEDFKGNQVAETLKKMGLE